MANKKQRPHIVTVAALAALIALGLACASSPVEAPRETDGPVSLDRAVERAARSIENNVEAGLKIALLNFRSPTDQFSEYVLEELSRELVHGRKLIVVDRRELDLIRQEEEFQLSDDVSDESAQAIGKKLGAQLIVSGSLSAVGNVYRFRIRALYVETAAIAASPAADISAAEERVMFLLDGKGPIQVNASSRQSPAQTSSGSSNSVYIAGSYENREANKTACYWVNGVRTDLPVPAEAIRSAAAAVVLSGGKVYAAGYYSKRAASTTEQVACYWVDGARTDLTVPAETTTHSTATAIAVSDGKVYVSGYWFRYDARRGKVTACSIWVDGVRTDLPVPSSDWVNDPPIAEALVVSGGKVYVAGIYSEGGTTVMDFRRACYWVDGVRTDLSDETAIASAIAVSGSKVYVAGRSDFYGIDAVNFTAYYCVDGVKTELPVPGGVNSANATAIAVSGGRIYVAGSYSKVGASGRTACYWVDGARTDLPVPEIASYSTTSAIAVSGARVYVSGYHGNTYEGGTACYWIDGVRTDLPSPFRAVSSAMAVGD